MRTAETTDAPEAAEQEDKTSTAPDRQAGEIDDDKAYDYWGGMLFKLDKTGTDQLKGLLRGLKNVIVRGDANRQTTRYVGLH